MKKKKRIVLFGYSSFGRQLYKNLHDAGHDVKVVSSIQEYVERGRKGNINITKINIKRNDDILSLGINPENDLLYCAMNKTANNLFLVLSLRTLFPTANIISISNSSESTRKLKFAGVDNVIDLYEATARRTVNVLTKPAVTKALDEIIYNHNELQMLEITLPENSFMEGRNVSEIGFKKLEVILIAIIDKEIGQELIFTDHRYDHKLDAGDILVLVGTTVNLKKLQDKLLIKQTN
jgi:voltage-gated potassium channel